MPPTEISMNSSATVALTRRARPGPDIPPPGDPMEVILSFDVEEHFRIEAAAGLRIDPALEGHYGERAATATRWLLERRGERGIRATFFVVGQLARRDPALVRSIHRAGHEVASHGWDHRRVTEMTPASFREDVRLSRDTLEQAIG